MCVLLLRVQRPGSNLCSLVFLPPSRPPSLFDNRELFHPELPNWYVILRREPSRPASPLPARTAGVSAWFAAG